MKDLHLILLSLCTSGIALALLSRSTAKRFLRYIFAPALFVLLMLSIIYAVADYFTDEGVNEAVIFHLQYGMEGAGFGEYWKLIGISLICIVFSFVVSVLSFYLLSTRPTDRRDKRTQSVLYGAAAVAVMCVGYAINPATVDLYDNFKQAKAENHGEKGYVLDDNFVYPDDIGIPDKPLNFVFIYLESLEQSYFKEKVFPGLVPGLSSLRKQSLFFSNILQVTNTGWTIAGMTASQCGIPLATSGMGNSMSKMDRFLPGALCIGDILSGAGYSLNYMGGAFLEFSGKGKFYTTHGFSDVRGFEELYPMLDTETPASVWGLYDPDLLNLAMDRFTELSESGGPFGLFMLTLDTHHPKGHIPSQCADITYGDGSNEMLNAVHCSDRVVSTFIRKIRDSQYSDNTMIVVASDHLAFRNLAYDKLSRTNRKNLFFINLPEKIKPEQVDRLGSTLDIGPTVMTHLGFDMGALGLGRDLHGSDKTIMEKKGAEIYDYLGSLSNGLMDLWDFPQLDDGMRIVPGSAPRIEFGNRTIKLPALISVADTFEVEKITFADYSPRGLVDHVEDLDRNQLFIWVDFCRNVSPVLLDYSDLLGKAVCATTGSLDAESIYTRTIETKTPLVLGNQEIVQELSAVSDQNRPDTTSYTERIDRLKMFPYHDERFPFGDKQ